MLNKIVLLLLFLSAVNIATADKREGNFDFTHNRFSFSGGLTSSDSYHLETSYHYMFNRYVGLGGGLGYWKVWYEDGWAAEKDWEIESDKNTPSNLYLHPSVGLKSPAIMIRNIDLGIFAEPGIMLNIPYKGVEIRQYTNWPNYELHHISTSKGQWCALDLRVGLYVNFGSIGFGAGYMMSNFDVYSQYRHLAYKGNSFAQYYPVESFMQGGWLTASYYF